MFVRSKPVEKPLRQAKYKGAVTFLDVLGWKEIWKENVVDDNQNPITRLLDFSELIRDREKDFSNSYKYIFINESERDAVRGLNLCIDWTYKSNLYSNFINKGPHMQEVVPKYFNTWSFLENKGNIKKENRNENLRNLLKTYRILLINKMIYT